MVRWDGACLNIHNYCAKANAKTRDATFVFHTHESSSCLCAVDLTDSTHGSLSLHSMLGACFNLQLLLQQLTSKETAKKTLDAKLLIFQSTYSQIYQICSRCPISCLVTCLGLPRNSWPITRTRPHQPLPEVRQSSSCILSHQP